MENVYRISCAKGLVKKDKEIIVSSLKEAFESASIELIKYTKVSIFENNLPLSFSELKERYTNNCL